MKYLIPVLAVFLFTACSRGKNVSLPYDMPPTAPIPPETYCFQSKSGSDAASVGMVITITGDSVFGNLDYSKSESLPSGSFIGVIYGKTLNVNYKYKDSIGWKMQEQEWKMAGDSIYKPAKKLSPGSIVDSAQLMNPVALPWILYKVPCK